MQACPYDALYIDPDTHTAAKCNYCAHRVEMDLQPACVVVCPEHAIISGDTEDPHSEIGELLSREKVTVRKPEKGTAPNVFYIDGDETSIDPNETERSKNYIWSSQSTGVGHFSKFAEVLAEGKDLLEMARNNGKKDPSSVITHQNDAPAKDGKRRVYDSPDKGVLWGWEVSAYIFTKAISAGIVLVLFMAWITSSAIVTGPMELPLIGVSLIFLALTTVFLVMDLDQPKRFLYVLLRPHWGSWLVKGGYALTFFGGVLTLMIVAMYFKWVTVAAIAFYVAAALAVIVAIYTAFLFAQAKGRDFWQSPVLAIHMLTHSVMCGAAALSLLGFVIEMHPSWSNFLWYTLIISTSFHLVVMFFELATPHPTTDAKKVGKMILKGQYNVHFWTGIVSLGNVIPIALLAIEGNLYTPVASVFVLIGVYIAEHVWVHAPQRISLT